jgi:hypothetical protein
MTKKIKLESAAVKLSTTPISKKQEPRLRPFQLPDNFNPTIADASKNEFLSGKVWGKFLQVIADSIFRFKSYPTEDEYKHVSQQMVKKWPFFSNGGNFVVYYSTCTLIILQHFWEGGCAHGTYIPVLLEHSLATSRLGNVWGEGAENKLGTCIQLFLFEFFTNVSRVILV